MKKLKKRSALVTNEAATAPALQTNQLQHFTWNLATKLVRNGELEGRKCLIVPMVMMVEGVHNGSGGPMLWPADELGKTPEVYNHKPVVVNHPEDADGKAISACTEQVLNTRKIGIIMNARFDDLNRLCADAYLDEERTKEVDVSVYNAVKKGEPMECSTGVYTDNEVKKGVWNNEAYNAIARNHRPDHLAVLPDAKGACSMADGAGFIRNQVFNSSRTLDSAGLKLVETVVRDTITNAIKEGGSLRKYAKNLEVNESSFETIRSLIYKALETKFPSDKGYACPWIESVFDTWFVYCLGSKLFRLGYSSSDTSVKLTGEPAEVVRVTEYRAAPVSNQSASTPKTNRGNTMDKEQIVADLITNHGYAETDRGMLMGMDLAALTRIQASSTATLNKAKTTTAPAVKTEPATNAAPAKQLTEEEYLKQAPPGVRAVLANSERILNNEKAKHIATIKTNVKNKFTDGQLLAMDVEQLSMLADLATSAVAPTTTNVQQHDFGGLGSGAPIDNAAAKVEGAALPATSWDFDK